MKVNDCLGTGYHFLLHCHREVIHGFVNNSVCMLIQGTLVQLCQWNKVMKVGRGIIGKVVNSRRKRMKKGG